MSPNAFEYPSFLIFFSVFGALIASLEYWRNRGKRSFAAVIVILLFVNAVVISYSYLKLIEIQNRVSKKGVTTVSGMVTSFESYNGKDIFFVSGLEFEVNYSDLYCISRENAVRTGERVTIRYIDLGQWAGFIAGACILSIESAQG